MGGISHGTLFETSCVGGWAHEAGSRHKSLAPLILPFAETGNLSLNFGGAGACNFLSPKGSPKVGSAIFKTPLLVDNHVLQPRRRELCFFR